MARSYVETLIQGSGAQDVSDGMSTYTVIIPLADGTTPKQSPTLARSAHSKGTREADSIESSLAGRGDQEFNDEPEGRGARRHIKVGATPV